jgi:hypothetical protein
MSSWSLTVLTVWTGLSACGSAAPTTRPLEAPPPPSPSASASAEGPPGASDELGDAASPTCEACEVRSSDGRISSPEPVLELTVEAPHEPGHFPRPEGRVRASVADEELARWNVGGSSSASHPSGRPGFHPAVRVVVDTTVVDGGVPERSRSALSQNGIRSRSRSKGYWPVRLCYEDLLRAGDRASAVVRMRMDIGSRGNVQRTVLHEATFEDRDDGAALAKCLEEAVAKLNFEPAPRRRIRVDLDIRLWPGDAPLPSRPPAEEAPTPEEVNAAGTLTKADARAKRARREALEQFAQGLHSEAQECFMSARARDPRVWGRLALIAEIDESGRVRSQSEYESAFPDPEAVACVTRHLDSAQAPSSGAEAETWVFAFRLASPSGTPDPQTETTK